MNALLRLPLRDDDNCGICEYLSPKHPTIILSFWVRILTSSINLLAVSSSEATSKQSSNQACHSLPVRQEARSQHSTLLGRQHPCVNSTSRVSLRIEIHDCSPSPSTCRPSYGCTFRHGLPWACAAFASTNHCLHPLPPAHRSLCETRPPHATCAAHMFAPRWKTPLRAAAAAAVAAAVTAAERTSDF